MFSSQVVFIAATCVNIFHEVSPKTHPPKAPFVVSVVDGFVLVWPPWSATTALWQLMTTLYTNRSFPDNK